MSMHLRRLLATLLVGTLGLALMGLARAQLAAPAPAPVVEVAPPPPEPPAPRTWDEEHVIRHGETLGAILPRYGVTQVQAVLAATKPHFDLARVRAGSTLVFHFLEGQSQPTGFTYRIDEDRTLLVELQGDEALAAVQEAWYEPQEGTHVFEVRGSLWESALAAGLRAADIVALAEVFQWELDFNTELQPGARVTVLSEDLHAEDGTFVRLARMLAVRIDNGGKVFTSLRFVDSAGEVGWFHPDGEAARRPFLRSPLEFSRVTSGFNPRRFHPVLKVRRPHNGTDFGAPTGTPVRAIADAVVSFSGVKGGYGNHIRLDHDGPYETTYSHLSRLAVKRGQKVRQGQVIGYVGTTGMSTGPHLHYEMLASGRPVDPMKIELPSSQPLPESERGAFFALRDEVLPRLDAAPAPTAPAPGADEPALVLADD